MSIKVLFFASLRDELGMSELDIEVDRVATVADVWSQITAGTSMPSNLLMALNQEYVNPDAPVKEGDEVAFFPPVTGG